MEKLPPDEAKLFHHVVAKLLWASIRARPDLLTAISFLTSKFKAPDQHDYKKLVQLLTYFRDSINLPLTLGYDASGIIKWWADAAFGVRTDLKSQSGGTLSLRTGSAISQSKRQSLNTKSSTEAELVAADDVIITRSSTGISWSTSETSTRELPSRQMEEIYTTQK